MYVRRGPRSAVSLNHERGVGRVSALIRLIAACRLRLLPRKQRLGPEISRTQSHSSGRSYHLWEVHMTAHHQTLIASEYPYQRSDVLPIMINRALGAPRGQSQRGWEPRSSKSRHVKSLQVTLRHITSSPSQVTSSPSPVQSSPSQDLTFRILAVHRWQGAVVSASATAPPSTTSRGSAKLGFERCNPVEQRLLLRRVLTRHVGLYRRHLSAQVKSSRVKSSQVKSSRVESSRVESSRVESGPIRSSRVKARQGKARQRQRQRQAKIR